MATNVRVLGEDQAIQYGVDVDGGLIPLVNLSAGYVWSQITIAEHTARGNLTP
jgi:hypothetical protein